MDEAILLYALRYAIGRQTFAPSEVQSAIRAALPIRDAGIREAMVRDIEERTEGRARSLYGPHPLGDPMIDAPGWLALLKELKA